MRPPTKLDDDVQARIAAVVRAGGTLALAAQATGVGERTVHRWLARGERGGTANAPYRQFREAVERARAEGEGILVAQLSRAAAKGSWPRGGVAARTPVSRAVGVRR
jgi:transposase